MDLTLRIQTPGGPLSPNNINNEAISSCDSLTATTNTSQNNTVSSSDYPNNIVINNNVNGSSILPSNMPPHVSNASSTNNQAKEDWMKAMMTEMKTMFDGFLMSMSKLLETFLGKKPTDSTIPTLNQNTTSQTPIGSSQAPAETFSQRTMRNMGSMASSKVNEESMREYVLMYQLYQKDPQAEALFKTSLEKNKSDGIGSDAAIKKTLIELEGAGKLQRWESDWIYSLSARAAQFDNDLQALSQNQALTSDLAIKTAEANLVKIATGVEIPKKLQIA